MTEPGGELGDASGGTTLPAPTASRLHGPSGLRQVLPELKHEAWESFTPGRHPLGRQWARSPVKESPTGHTGCLAPAAGRPVTWRGSGLPGARATTPG